MKRTTKLRHYLEGNRESYWKHTVVLNNKEAEFYGLIDRENYTYTMSLLNKDQKEIMENLIDDKLGELIYYQQELDLTSIKKVKLINSIKSIQGDKWGGWHYWDGII